MNTKVIKKIIRLMLAYILLVTIIPADFMYAHEITSLRVPLGNNKDRLEKILNEDREFMGILFYFINMLSKNTLLRDEKGFSLEEYKKNIDSAIFSYSLTLSGYTLQSYRRIVEHKNFQDMLDELERDSFISCKIEDDGTKRYTVNLENASYNSPALTTFFAGRLLSGNIKPIWGREDEIGKKTWFGHVTLTPSIYIKLLELTNNIELPKRMDILESIIIEAVFGGVSLGKDEKDKLRRIFISYKIRHRAEDRSTILLEEILHDKLSKDHIEGIIRRSIRIADDIREYEAINGLNQSIMDPVYYPFLNRLMAFDNGKPNEELKQLHYNELCFWYHSVDLKYYLIRGDLELAKRYLLSSMSFVDEKDAAWFLVRFMFSAIASNNIPELDINVAEVCRGLLSYLETERGPSIKKYISESCEKMERFVILLRRLVEHGDTGFGYLIDDIAVIMNEKEAKDFEREILPLMKEDFKEWYERYGLRPSWASTNFQVALNIRDNLERMLDTIRTDELFKIEDLTSEYRVLCEYYNRALLVIGDRLKRANTEGLRDAMKCAENITYMLKEGDLFLKGEINRESFCLREEVEDIIIDYGKGRFPKKAVKLNLSRDLIIDGDKFQLRYVIFELIKNAFQNYKGQEDKFSMEISSEKVSDKIVRIKFEDNSGGMLQEAFKINPVFGRENIFTLNWTRRQGGSGLGLTAVYYIIKDHKGVINIETVHGKGSIFTIELPISSQSGLSFLQRSRASI